MGNPVNHGRLGRDEYDRLPADDFLCQRQMKMPRLPRRKMRQLKRLIATQQTGKVATSQWWNDYHQYMASEAWQRLRERLIRERGPNCERCGKFGDVDLHHLTYVRLRHELDEDLKLYCRPCHNLMHPKKDINFGRSKQRRQ
jgi:5-methylcytosine-specific restriction endonuclease McrA